jgi:hypothetical protein
MLSQSTAWALHAAYLDDEGGALYCLVVALPRKGALLEVAVAESCTQT